VAFFKKGTISEYKIRELLERNKKYKLEERVQKVEGYKLDSGEILGVEIVSLYCNLKLSFIKELPKYKYVTKENFDSSEHCYREIAYYKDEIVSMS
jgi:hypothetical protein